MSLTKEECEKALFIINVLGKYEDGSPALLEIEQPEEYEIIKQLIEEHFDNPHLKFEELCEGMWVWDNRTKGFVKIRSTFIKNVVNSKTKEERKEHRIKFKWGESVYEENRFYRKQVEE